MAYIGVSPSNGVRQKHTYTATASQTTFSGAGSEGVSLSYRDSNYVDVYRNGVKLGDADYTATSGTSIVLGEGAAVSDIIEIVTYDVFSVADTVSKADGGTFDGNVTMAGTLAVTGATTLSSNLSVDGGTIKLDGNYPVGTGNVALGDTALDSLTSGSNNTAIGSSALTANTTASNNTAVGYQAGLSNTTGTRLVALGYTAALNSTEATHNTAIGYQSQRSNTTGGNNSALGDNSLYTNTTGQYNTGLGSQALFANTTASNNVAVGYQSLYSNTTGIQNVAVGQALTRATEAQDNIALGLLAGRGTTTGSYNIAIGTLALGSGSATTSEGNVGVGYYALSENSGNNNVAIGRQALHVNTTASNNTAVGYGAGFLNTTGTSNVFIGRTSGQDNTTGSYNTALGASALVSNTTAGENTSVGNTSMFSNTEGFANVAIGAIALYSNTTGIINQCFGYGAGYHITTGSKNTILGAFNGNQGGLDIRTSDNNIVISDGDGNLRNYYRGSPGDWAWQADRSGGYAYVFDNTNATNPFGLLIRTTTSDDNDGNEAAIQFTALGTNRFVVANTGNVTNTNNSYGAISDIKLKEQIEDASSQWDDIKALTIRKFKFKSDVAKGDSDAHWRLGVIAQEVESAGMGGLVLENIDTEINAEKNVINLGTTTKQVKYSILYMKAVKALQEAMTRIETLEAKVTALEGA